MESDLCPQEGSQEEKGDRMGRDPPQGGVVEPQTGHPSPGVLCEGGKPPWLARELLGQRGCRSLGSTCEECAQNDWHERSAPEVTGFL